MNRMNSGGATSPMLQGLSNPQVRTPTPSWRATRLLHQRELAPAGRLLRRDTDAAIARIAAPLRRVSSALTVVPRVATDRFCRWWQRSAIPAPRVFLAALANRLPCARASVWIFGLLFYVPILYVNLVLEDSEQFTRVAFSYLLLLALQSLFFMAYLVRTPTAKTRPGDWERLLGLERRHVAPTDAYPSMHTSMATLTALHLYAHSGPLAFAFPSLIAFSCILTKRYYIVDVPAGAALGWFAYAVLQRVAAI
jgi:membrane-associated phospholipid phosphatase